MDIRRNERVLGTALEWVQFCLDHMENAKGFRRDIGWGTEIVYNCTVEEIVGALVAAEQELKKVDEIVSKNDELMERITRLRMSMGLSGELPRFRPFIPEEE